LAAANRGGMGKLAMITGFIEFKAAHKADGVVES